MKHFQELLILAGLVVLIGWPTDTSSSSNSENGAEQSQNYRMSHFLEELKEADRSNVEIIVTLRDDSPISAVAKVKIIEQLWNSGEISAAMIELRSLESDDGIEITSIEQIYKTPIQASIASTEGNDVEVSSLDSAYTVDYDVDTETGKLFICFTYWDGNLSGVNRYHWLYSADRGQTWNTILTGVTSSHIYDIDCAVARGYCLLARTNGTQGVEVMRYDISAGSLAEYQAGGYYQRAFTNSTGVVTDVELATTDELTAPVQEACWMAALSSIGKFYWLSTGLDVDGWTPWSSTTLGSGGSLDLTLNPVHGSYGDPYWMFASYIASGNPPLLRIVGLRPGPPVVRLNYSLGGYPDTWTTSISSWGDTVFCSFTTAWPTNNEVEILSSYNAGMNWYVALAESEEDADYASDLTARFGQGIGLAYASPWVNFPFAGIRGRMSWMDYDWSPWMGPYDYTLALPSERKPHIEYIGEGYYGMAWITEWYASNHGKVYFDAMPRCCQTVGNTNGDTEGKINVSDLTYLVDYLFGIPSGPKIACPEEGNVNGDKDGNINISDLTYLVAYLFGIPNGPPPPPCPVW